jgi:hypothetical protein
MDGLSNYNKTNQTLGRNSRPVVRTQLVKEKTSALNFSGISNFPNISPNHYFQESKILNQTNKLSHSSNFLSNSIERLNKSETCNRHLNRSTSTIHPHPLLRSSVNIKWFRDRSTSKMIEKSLNNYYEVNEELDGLPDSKIIIQPKYLFSESTFKQISKLKYLFEQFDKDKSSKHFKFKHNFLQFFILFSNIGTLELREMEQMFKINKIPMDMTNLIKLFYKPSKDGQSMAEFKDQLDFNSLVSYAISTTTDEKYRHYIRNIKGQKEKKNINKEELYIPMNFNSLLEHFNNKGKIREKLRDVSCTIAVMEKMTRGVKEAFRKNLKTNSLQNIEKENKLHNEISYSRIVRNFEDIVKISSDNLEKIRSTNTALNPKKQLKPLKMLKINKKEENKQPNEFNLPLIDSTASSFESNFKYDNLCPSNMKSFYSMIPVRKSKKISDKILNVSKNKDKSVKI